MDMPSADHMIYKPESAYCVVSAARRFNLPIEGLLSILLVEGGKLGGISRNTNGTVDLGPMQINTIWLNKGSPLSGHVDYARLRDDLCTNVHSAAWILASHLPRAKDIWTAIGYYHSPGNKQYAWNYKLKVNSKLQTARQILNTSRVYKSYIQSFYGNSAVSLAYN